ncbi:hypothetical protein F1B92_02000 [Campylobacter sp. FMV-PI01]|uniref:FxsA family protein n=1 Tax=Campylobacter portucalensis TaxID=2608384 RepID=A0A6L5WI94_9BACT|nr:FxsA family protein [Campylobacter portucalensis]MSN95977.1 hypothetical protein [Campylobacter portucalensis]
MKKLLLPYFVFEIIFVVFFLSEYSFFILFFEILFSAIIGYILITKFGVLNITKNLTKISPSIVFGNLGLAISGMLLMVPGILSDSVGVLIIFVSLIMKIIKKDRDKFNNTQNNTYNYTKNDEVIDVEIIEEGENLWKK